MPESPKDSLSKLEQRALQWDKKIAEKNYKKVLLGFSFCPHIRISYMTSVK